MNTCSACEKTFSSQARLDRHIETYEECLMCGELTCALDKHIRCATIRHNLDLISRTANDYFLCYFKHKITNMASCGVCSQTFASEAYLQRHINRCKKCVKCNKLTCSLDGHRKVCGSVAPDYMIKCKYCPGYFMKQNDLDNHEVMHEAIMDREAISRKRPRDENGLPIFGRTKIRKTRHKVK